MVSGFALNAQSQQLNPLKQNLNFDIDKLGDAHLQMSMTFDASQWDNFKKIMGSNEDMLKRSMERALPAYFLRNFNYKEDAMNRSYTLSFDALGYSRINDNGDWEIDVDLKNPDITKISDHNYALTSTFNSQGTLLEQLVKLNFPDGASDIEQTKNAFGKAIFTYTLTPGGSKINLLFLIGGVLFIALAVLFYFKPRLIPQRKPAINKTPPVFTAPNPTADTPKEPS